MFQTQIGPTGTLKGFLRPETSQGNYSKVFDPINEYSIGLLLNI